jgi:hypothetical protein
MILSMKTIVAKSLTGDCIEYKLQAELYGPGKDPNLR